MNKRTLQILEKCYCAEIAGHGMPTQFGHGPCEIEGMKVSSAVVRAIDDGLIEPREYKDRTLTVRGFGLTHRGRLLYCETCDVEG